MVQLLNFFFFITSMVVPRGTAAPVLFQLFVSRDVPTGAPSSNGTLIPILIPEFPFLVYLHSRKLIRSMDRAKSGVLVRASRPILFTDIIGRSSSARNAFFRFVPVLNFLLLESMGDRGWLESFCGLSCIQFFRTLFSLPRAKRERISQCKTLRPNGNEQRCVANYKMRCPGYPSIERGRRLTGGLEAECNCEPEAPRNLPFQDQTIHIASVHCLRFPFVLLFEPVERLLSSEEGIKRLLKIVSFCEHNIKVATKEQYQEFVECFGPVAFPVPLSSSGAGGGPEIGLEALALPTSRLLMAVGHDYYKKVKINLPLSHGGVCIFLLGVLLSNTKKIQFTQRLPLGPELHMGKERCCLRGLDHLHGPTFHGICGNFILSKPSTTGDRFMLEHDESLLRADLLPILTPASYEKGKLEHFLHRWMKNNEHKNLWFTMFPEKRYFFSIRETTSTTEVAIHTNLFTDLYAPIGTGSSRTGGWYTTIMKLPFLFSIRIGFLLASSGGSRSLLRQLQKDKLHWNRDSSVEFRS